MMVSHKLGLPAQEIALLELKEVCQLGLKRVGDRRSLTASECSMEAYLRGRKCAITYVFS